MKNIFRDIVVAILIFEAKMVLWRHRPRVVAISGSVGKTSTKDMIYTALSGSVHVRKSEKSFNSEIGVPLTVLGLHNARHSASGWFENIVRGVLVFFSRTYPDVLVLEVGSDHPGDMQRLSWVRPHVVVFTRFPDVPVHVEFFSSPDAVNEEDRGIRRALQEGGVLCINADDTNMRNEMVAEGQSMYRYGYAEGATVLLSDYAPAYTDGVLVGASVRVAYAAAQATIFLRGVVGKHYTYSVGAAALVACAAFELPLELVAKRLSSQTAADFPPGRMRVFAGVAGSVVVDDTYNASPAAVTALLETVQGIDVSGKKVLVLGDMMELGEHTAREHRKAGEQVADVADVFVGVGVRMKEAVQAVQQKGNCRTEWFSDAEKAGAFLPEILGAGDIVAVKGSRHSMRMERTVKKALADSGDEQYLVQ